MRRSPGLVVAAVVAAVVTAVIGCTPSTPARSFRPTLTWGACPDDVEASFLTEHTCGVLTVLAHRHEPDGAVLRLLAVRAKPPVSYTNQLGIGFGSDFGQAQPVTGGIATGVIRLGGPGLQIEWRGTGPHTSTSLRCPETDALGFRAAGLPHDDPALAATFLAAVSSCAKRLRASGVDPGDYTPVEIAQDIEDLRRAAGVARWRIAGSYGSQSDVLFSYLQQFPGRIDAAYLDSPTTIGLRSHEGGAASLQDALASLFRACRSEPSCGTRYSDLSQSWIKALDLLSTSPLRGSTTVTGQSVDVLVDAPKLVRAARLALAGDGPNTLTLLPRIIANAATGSLDPELARLVAQDPIYCSGYRPYCGDKGFSLGSYLSAFCSAPAPAAEDEQRERNAEQAHPAYLAVFSTSPYASACARWGVTRPGPSPRQSPGIPVLLMSGDFDSFSRPINTKRLAEQLGNGAHLVVVPAQTHNVLGFLECALTIRNRWARHPMSPPEDRLCTGTAPLDFR